MSPVPEKNKYTLNDYQVFATYGILRYSTKAGLLYITALLFLYSKILHAQHGDIIKLFRITGKPVYRIMYALNQRFRS